METKTTKRPLAVMSPMLVLNAAVGVVVNWTTKGSGVGVVVWADTEAREPPRTRHTMLAHNNQKPCFTKASAKNLDKSRLDTIGELEERPF